MPVLTAAAVGITPGQIDYVVDGIDLGPSSVLNIEWYRDGERVFPGEAFSARDNVHKLISFVASTEGELFAGEYHLLVTLNADPVYADVVVLEVG
jgi:hypothetical protein